MNYLLNIIPSDSSISQLIINNYILQINILKLKMK